MCAVAVFFAAVSLASAGASLQSQSRLWLVGDSTLHLYESTATVLNVSLSFKESPSGSLLDSLKSNGMEKLDVAVPVKEMRSGKPPLDRNMQKALKAVENPDITFQMKSYTTSPAEGQAVKINASGQLKIAGVEKPVELEGTAELLGDLLEIRGSKDLLMTDYGVKPPSMLGVVRTKNEVTVHFDLIIGSK